jgi:hypothetical protein
MLGKGVVVSGEEHPVAVVKPKHGVNGSGAPSSIGLVAEVSPKVELALLWKGDPEVLRSVNVKILRALGW